MERKVGSGRKGTVDEEEYLLKSISKLVARWTVTQGTSPVVVETQGDDTDSRRGSQEAVASSVAAVEGAPRGGCGPAANVQCIRHGAA